MGAAHQKAADPPQETAVAEYALGSWAGARESAGPVGETAEGSAAGGHHCSGKETRGSGAQLAVHAGIPVHNLEDSREEHPETGGYGDAESSLHGQRVADASTEVVVGTDLAELVGVQVVAVVAAASSAAVAGSEKEAEAASAAGTAPCGRECSTGES